jgi:hypothetical protein
MKNIYYQIWVDGIVRLKSQTANKGMWKFYSMCFITMAMALNIALIMAILQRNILHYYFYNLNVSITPSHKFNSLLEYFILYFSIPLLVNYLLIFRNKKYLKLIEQYKTYNGILCVTYLMASYFLPFILLGLGWIFIK